MPKSYTHYKCLYPGCEEYERYRAIGNVPKYAHLCKKHWEIDPDKEHYTDLTEDD